MTKNDEIKKVQEIFSFYRGLILDTFEQELGDQTNWHHIRSRILKALSPERGLEFKVLEVLAKQDGA